MPNLAPVGYFSDQIKIRVQTTNRPAEICKATVLRDFAGGEPVSLYRYPDGRLLCTRPDGGFIQGKECS